MPFIDPVGAYVRWGTFTVPTGTATMTITHGAGFAPTTVVIFPKDVYAWAGNIQPSNYTGLTFDITITLQEGDAVYDWAAGKN